MIDYEGRNWLAIITSVRGTVLRGVMGRVLVTVLIAIVAIFAKQYHSVHVPPLGHTLLGAALGLLLVFRTNASYDRFWEGRKLLGALTNRMRDLARQIATFVEGDDESARRIRTEGIRYVNALHALIRQYLRQERDLEELGDLLKDHEKEALEAVVVRPCVAVTWLSALMTRAVREGKLAEARQLWIDTNLTAVVDYWGGAERIRNTPMPFAYAHHIKLFLMLFCFTSPFALVESTGILTPFAAGFLALALFGIDEIGVEIEDPFGYDANDLPLDRMSDRVKGDTEAILAAPLLPP